MAIRYGRPLVLFGDTARAERLPLTVPEVESVQEAVDLANLGQPGR